MRVISSIRAKPALGNKLWARIRTQLRIGVKPITQGLSYLIIGHDFVSLLSLASIFHCYFSFAQLRNLRRRRCVNAPNFGVIDEPGSSISPLADRKPLNGRTLK